MFRQLLSLVENAVQCRSGTEAPARQARRCRQVRPTIEALERREVPTVTLVNPGNQLNFDGDQVSVANSASDSGGGTPTFSATGLPGGLSIDSSTGTIEGTVATNADANGPYTVTITASDANGSASQAVIWDVGYPVGAVNPGDQTSYVDNSQVTLPIHATDAAGGTPTFSATGLPTGLTIDSATGMISGAITSNGGATTTYSTTVTAGDGTYSASTSFQWIVNNVVVFTHTSDQTNNNGDQVSLHVYASDANNATLTFSAADLPDGLTINQSTGLISGTIATAADSNYSTTATITATDGTYTATQMFSWAVNDPVSVTNPGAQSNIDGDTVSMQVYASDTTSGTLTYGRPVATRPQHRRAKWRHLGNDQQWVGQGQSVRVHGHGQRRHLQYHRGVCVVCLRSKRRTHSGDVYGQYAGRHPRGQSA
jgi:hypothetical protein